MGRAVHLESSPEDDTVIKRSHPLRVDPGQEFSEETAFLGDIRDGLGPDHLAAAVVQEPESIRHKKAQLKYGDPRKTTEAAASLVKAGRSGGVFVEAVGDLASMGEEAAHIGLEEGVSEVVALSASGQPILSSELASSCAPFVIDVPRLPVAGGYDQRRLHPLTPLPTFPPDHVFHHFRTAIARARAAARATAAQAASQETNVGPHGHNMS